MDRAWGTPDFIARSEWTGRDNPTPIEDASSAAWSSPRDHRRSSGIGIGTMNAGRCTHPITGRIRIAKSDPSGSATSHHAAYFNPSTSSRNSPSQTPSRTTPSNGPGSHLHRVHPLSSPCVANTASGTLAPHRKHQHADGSTKIGSVLSGARDQPIQSPSNASMLRLALSRYRDHANIKLF